MKSVGNDLNLPMNQSSVSRTLHQIIAMINNLHDMYINFSTTRAERQAVSAW